MNYADARAIAERLIERLSPSCERIEVAGSVRRQQPFVHDIELVAVPRFEETEPDLFGSPTNRRSLVDGALVGLGEFNCNGPRYKQILLAEGICLDLFIVLPPAQWVQSSPSGRGQRTFRTG